MRGVESAAEVKEREAEAPMEEKIWEDGELFREERI